MSKERITQENSKNESLSQYSNKKESAMNKKSPASDKQVPKSDQQSKTR